MARKNIAKYLNPWMFVREKRQRKFELVRQRDGDICWRCGHGMDFTEPRKGRKSATIEHVMPLSLGGTWALENLVLCHVGCNRHLGANPPEQKQRMRLRR